MHSHLQQLAARGPGSARAGGWDAARGLSKVSDACLASILFLAPLFMGGRHPTGLLVYVGLVFAAAVTWSAAQCCGEQRPFRKSGVELLLGAGILLILIQLLPLPAWLLTLLSPQTAELLPLWNAPPGGALGVWNQLSLAPEMTRGGLVMLVAHALLFLVVMQRVDRIDHIEQLLRWVALAGIGMACLGLAQFLFGNGKFFWVYEHPFRDTLTHVKGTFSNENHFCQFLALSIGPLIWWIQQLDSSRHAQGTKGSWDRATRLHQGSSLRCRDSNSKRAALVRFGLQLGLGVIALAGLLSMSRGGILVMCVAAVTSVGILAAKSVIGRRSALAFGSVAVVVGIALGMVGVQPILEQMGTMTSVAGLDQSSVRQTLWAADLEAVSQFPLLGIGGGGHIEVYPTYFAEFSHVRYTHAESGYIQILTEGGLAGVALLVAALVICGRWCFVALRGSQPIAAAGAVITASLLVSAIHSIWDFVWYIPACMSLAVVLAACMCRLFQLQRSTTATSSRATATRSNVSRISFNTEVPASRYSWTLATIVTMCLAIAATGHQLPLARAAISWEAYLALTQRDDLADFAVSTDSERELASLRGRLHLLTKTLAANPRDSGANLVMASHLLRYFNITQMQSENAMWLAQIREAAAVGGFRSQQDQNAWVKRVCGERFSLLLAADAYARRGVRLCPMRGEGYIYLDELSFLHAAPSTNDSRFVAQALQVRPYRGSILLAAGKQAASRGDIEIALDYWKRAFHHNPEIQEQLIVLLSPYMTAETFLAEFEPGASGLAQLYQQFLDQERVEEAKTIALPYAEALALRAESEAGLKATKTWNQASRVYAFLADSSQELQCLANGLACSPQEYQQHRAYGAALLREGLYEEAITQFHWCQQRRRDDPIVHEKITQAAKLRRTNPHAMGNQRSAARPTSNVTHVSATDAELLR